jgi:hypothetical protein
MDSPLEKLDEAVYKATSRLSRGEQVKRQFQSNSYLKMVQIKLGLNQLLEIGEAFGVRWLELPLANSKKSFVSFAP